MNFKSILLSIYFITCVSQSFAADVTLRTAVYRYHQPIYANSTVELRASSCDILQLVLDVEFGHVDLRIDNGGVVRYPDRLYDAADIFSYSLYSDQQSKGFIFHSHDPDLTPENNPDIQVGVATIFGYCFTSSSYPTENIVLYVDDTKNKIRHLPDGTSQSY